MYTKNLYKASMKAFCFLLEKSNFYEDVSYSNIIVIRPVFEFIILIF